MTESGWLSGNASRGRGWPAAGALMLAALTIAPSALAQSPPPVSIELNKLEPLAAPGAGASAAGCRVYIVVTNPDPALIEQLRLDLILFGTDGVIARRVALDLAPLAPHKTAVRLFDLQGQPCDGIGHVLVNDVLGCQFAKHDDKPADEPSQTCIDRLRLSSRARAELTK